MRAVTALLSASLLAASLFAASLFAAGCASLASLTHPPRLGKEAPLVHRAAVSAGPAEEVEVLVDKEGVPHIFGASEEDLAYGLGFLHARDRLFQMIVLRHAAEGRLTEVFGPSVVEVDRQLRLVSFGVEAQIAAMSPRDRRIAEAYAAGVNEGAQHAGRSLEMQVLGVGFAPWTVGDIVRIARLQAWDLSMNLRSELSRARILSRLPAGDPRRAELLRDVPSGGVPIWRAEDQAPPAPADAPVEDPAPPDGGTAPAVAVATRELRRLDDARASALARALGYADGALPGRGLSNSWVVHGSRTQSGKPILVNDPHLQHRAPSVFYLAHLESKDLSVAGATIPGLPVVLIGHTRHMAWGLTTSFADTQDLVRIDVDPSRETHYLLDGEAVPFGVVVQRFQANGEVLLTESWRTTVFGPVLPRGFSNLAEPNATYALLWTGFDGEAASEQLSAFFDLARAEDVASAERALEKVPAPSQNVVLAFTDGTIAYRLMGLVPRRKSAAPIDRPRDGRTSEAGWSGYLAPDEKPRTDNPTSGYIVAANQRVLERDAPGAASVGGEAATPYRALRIHERLKALLDDGGAGPEALLAIQQDVVSVEARRLAPVLAAHCPTELTGQPEARVAAFCDAVRGFDGAYDKSSLGALPFTLLLDALHEEVLAVHLGDDVARQLAQEPFVVMALEEAILDEHRGQHTALFDDLRTKAREGLDGFVRRAAEAALVEVTELAGKDPNGWRWGRAHTLSFESPLAEAPVIGGLFATRPTEQSGWGRAPRAEGGLPVSSGAALRFLAEMREQPEARIITDLGQSGHLGHRHATDHLARWDAGNPFPLVTEREALEKSAEGRLLLKPKGAAE